MTNLAQIPAHIPDEWLLDHAAGATPEPVAVLVEAHLALSAPARATYARLAAVGGVLLEQQAPADVAPDALARLMARIEANPAPVRAAAPAAAGLLPASLSAYTGPSIENLAWRRIVRGVEQATLKLGGPSPYELSLLRIAAGKSIPQHTHEGDELLLVLAGSFEDGRAGYARGDVCAADASVDHAPVADRATDCLCLHVANAPIKLTGPFGRLLNPLLKLARR
ncbi:MAG: cupin domain-containing protein [Telmatospirillum sp.]|nr:cupin domain-containing protein [Telmatospirillum sp.]